MIITDSRKELEKAGYTIITETQPAVEPERTSIKFSDIIPELRNNRELICISESLLFKHQKQAIEALLSGKNIILKSGTGSGKTEAWMLHVLKQLKHKKRYRVIAVYPTLALSNDQVKRIESYSNAVNAQAIQIDAPTRDKLMRTVGKIGIRTRISSSNILITNPAFLMSELKKYVLRQTQSIFEPFFKQLDLIVIDELDFYGPRELALLLGMLEIIVASGEKKPQIVILTATLSNPVDMGEYLKMITGREYEIIEGKPFHVENRINIVLGKELYRIWLEIRKYKTRIIPEETDEDIIRAMNDFEVFRENAYRVLAYLNALGFEVPSIGMDYIEIISKYIHDDGVTLVFTRGITRAEEVAKRLKDRGYGDYIASHHHLVPKTRREEIEEKAREGKIKIIISPRTLTQGIDIGTIVRIVHLGLPEDIREFLQREGRKGRRPEIPFTESIVIPFGAWDWELLSKGIKALKKWLSMPLEKTQVNPKNLYLKLFTGIVKLVSPWLNIELDPLEKMVLEQTDVIKNNGLNRKKLKWIWDRLGFYELAPPYGIKRYLVEDSFKRTLEPIGHCDLVEIFQIGAFDYANDAIVIEHKTVRKGRSVTAVIEKPVRNIRFWENEAFSVAFEEYLDTKTRWGEEASLLKDLSKGRIFSRVDVVVYPPRKGFGLLTKIPNRVNWIVSSERPRIIKTGDKHIVTRNKKIIPVPSPVYGIYRDYTYGYIYEVDERLDSILLRLGLAFILIVLRRKEAISLGSLEYGIQIVGDKKYFELHETEASGFIEEADWLEIKRKIEEYRPDELDLILLNLLDEIAYAEFVSRGLNWEPIKQYSLIILDYIIRDRQILVKIMDELKAIPKPSRSQKIIVVDAILEDMEEKLIEEGPRFKLFAIVGYDGEEYKGYTDIILSAGGLKPPKELREIEDWIIDKLYYEDYQIIVPNKELSYYIEEAGLRKLPAIIKEKSIETLPLIEKIIGYPPSIQPFIEVSKQLFKELETAPSIDIVHKKVTELKEKGYKKLFKTEINLIEGYLKSRATGLYIAYLLHKMKKQ